MKRFILIVFTLMPLLVMAEIYRWVDETGKVHYGDKANNKGAVELKIESENNRTVNDDDDSDELSRKEKRERILEAMQQDSKERNRLRAEEQEKNKRKKQQCAQLKDKLRNLSKAAGVYELDKEGNRVFISNQKRNEGEQKLKKAISRHCH